VRGVGLRLDVNDRPVMAEVLRAPDACPRARLRL